MLLVFDRDYYISKNTLALSVRIYLCVNLIHQSKAAAAVELDTTDYWPPDESFRNFRALKSDARRF